MRLLPIYVPAPAIVLNTDSCHVVHDLRPRRSTRYAIHGEGKGGEEKRGGREANSEEVPQAPGRRYLFHLGLCEGWNPQE